MGRFVDAVLETARTQTEFHVLSNWATSMEWQSLVSEDIGTLYNNVLSGVSEQATKLTKEDREILASRVQQTGRRAEPFLLQLSKLVYLGKKDEFSHLIERARRDSDEEEHPRIFSFFKEILILLPEVEEIAKEVSVLSKRTNTESKTQGAKAENEAAVKLQKICEEHGWSVIFNAKVLMDTNSYSDREFDAIIFDQNGRVLIIEVKASLAALIESNNMDKSQMKSQKNFWDSVFNGILKVDLTYGMMTLRTFPLNRKNKKPAEVVKVNMPTKVEVVTLIGEPINALLENMGIIEMIRVFAARRLAVIRARLSTEEWQSLFSAMKVLGEADGLDEIFSRFPELKEKVGEEVAYIATALYYKMREVHDTLTCLANYKILAIPGDDAIRSVLEEFFEVS